jgi:hypothetical protein
VAARLGRLNSRWPIRLLHARSKKLSTDDTSMGLLASALREAALGAKPRPPQSLGVASLWTRPEVKGLYYNGKAIKLDGYRFVECRFDNCVLEVNSDNFELVGCVIDGSTRIQYSSNLAKVIRLFLGRYQWATAQYFHSFFLPTKNPDGTETISERGL